MLPILALVSMAVANHVVVGPKTTVLPDGLPVSVTGDSVDVVYDPILYAYFVAQSIGPLVVAAVICCCWWPFFLCCRCCGCWGGCYNRQGRCGGCLASKRDPEQLYTRAQVRDLKIALVVIVVLNFACFVALMVGNAEVSKGVSAVFDTVQTFVNTVTARLQALSALFNSPDYPYTHSAAGPIDTLLSTLSSYSTVSYRPMATSYNLDRSILLGVSVGFPLFIFVAAMVCALCNKTCCGIHYINVVLISLILFAVYISAAVHFIIVIGISDTCVTFEHLRANPGTNFPLDILACQSGSTIAFQQQLDDARSALQQATDNACNEMTPYCQATPPAPSLTNCPNCTQANIGDFGNALWNPSAATRPLPISVYNCTTECLVDSTQYNVSQHIVNQTTIFARYQNLINTRLAGLLDCGFVSDALDQLDQEICGDIVRGSRIMGAADVTFCLLSTAGIIILIVGQKRWNPANSSERKINDLDSEFEGLPKLEDEEVGQRPVNMAGADTWDSVGTNDDLTGSTKSAGFGIFRKKPPPPLRPAPAAAGAAAAAAGAGARTDGAYSDSPSAPGSSVASTGAASASAASSKSSSKSSASKSSSKPSGGSSSRSKSKSGDSAAAGTTAASAASAGSASASGTKSTSAAASSSSKPSGAQASASSS